MKIIFARRPVIGSYLIRAATWSPWSHCGVVLGSHVLHATWPDGVHMTPLDEFGQTYPHTEVQEIELPNEAGAIGFLVDQMGKPYDLTGLVGFGLHRDWQDPSRWFCSELIAAAMLQGGMSFVWPSARLSPGVLQLLASVRIPRRAAVLMQSAVPKLETVA